MDGDVDAAKQARYISAFNPDDIPGSKDSSASLEVTSLMNQLEGLDLAAQRLCLLCWLRLLVHLSLLLLSFPGACSVSLVPT